MRQWPRLRFGVRKPRLPFGVRKPRLPFGVRKPRLPFGVRKPRLRFGVRKPCLRFGVRKPCLRIGVRKPRLPFGVRRHGANMPSAYPTWYAWPAFAPRLRLGLIQHRHQVQQRAATAMVAETAARLSR